MSDKLERTPGVIRTISGRVIDLSTFNADDIDMFDIAWGLGNIRRYNGHTVEDYTVAHHSIIMSYYVPHNFKLEALLHDAAETYVGDIIWPIKALFPEMELFENKLAAIVMEHFNVPTATCCDYTDGYVKSASVADADRMIFEHECFEMGRPGTYHQNMEEAWIEAALAHEEYWYAPQYAFVQRFRELMGEVEDPYDLREDGTIDYLDGLWFKKKSDAVIEANERVIAQLAEQQKQLDEEITADVRLNSAQAEVDALLDSIRNTGAANDGNV